MNDVAPGTGHQGKLDIQGILKVAPHRYPFLMIDRILGAEGNKITGIKNVTYNEPCFTGHFPEKPVFPGVLMLEAIAQLGGFLILSRPENTGKLAYFTGAEEVKWRRLVVPGDQLRIDAEVLKERRGLVEVKGVATVEGELACEATVRFMIVNEQK
jgi:beta-hydroxyacyl-ACP dehydratase FabZ